MLQLTGLVLNQMCGASVLFEWAVSSKVTLYEATPSKTPSQKRKMAEDIHLSDMGTDKSIEFVLSERRKSLRVIWQKNEVVDEFFDSHGLVYLAG